MQAHGEVVYMLVSLKLEMAHPISYGGTQQVRPAYEYYTHAHTHTHTHSIQYCDTHTHTPVYTHMCIHSVAIMCIGLHSFTTRVCVVVASYPGLPMFFNVSREKLGRPGRFYDVKMTYWTRFGPRLRLAISAHSPTQCCSTC